MHENKSESIVEIFLSNWIFVLVVFFQLILWFVVKDDPFFGDGISTVSRAAVTIYDQKLQTIFYLPEHDPGHPTLIPFIYALIWTIFGKSLAISHAINTFFAILLLVGLRKVSEFILPKNLVDFPLLLLSCFAVFIAQSAMLLTHIPLTAFFLFALAALLKQYKFQFIFFTTILLFIHLEAVFLVAILFIIALFTQKINNKKEFFILMFQFLIPAFIFTIWLYLHYQHTGWLLSSPNYSEHRSLSTILGFFKNILLCFWRIADYGFLILFIPFLTNFKKLAQFFKSKIAIILIISLLVLITSISLFLSNSIAHRYFLPLQALFCLALVFFCRDWKSSRVYLLIAALSCMLIAGNFISYPGKCVGDASIAYRHYFSLLKKVELDYPKAEIYTFAPVYNPAKYVFLEEKGINVKPLSNQKLSDLSYIMVNSFVCDVPQEISDTINNWYGNSFSSGSIYVSIYANPAKVSKAAFWELRKTSMFEQWMLEQKRRYK